MNSFTDKKIRVRVLDVAIRLDGFLLRNATGRRRNPDLEQACIHVESVRRMCDEVLADPENEELWEKLDEYLDKGFAFFSR